MGRKLRTRLPRIAPASPQSTAIARLKQKEVDYRTKQARNYNQRHRATAALPPLEPEEAVWVRDLDCEGTVIRPTESPRSYLVATNRGPVRRNRRALLPLATDSGASDPNESLTPPVRADSPDLPSPMVSHRDTSPSSPYTTRAGRAVRPPRRLVEQ